jgi:hypothetical protein
MEFITQTGKKIRELNFNEKRKMVLEQHQSLINELIKFASEKFGFKWSFDKAETLFLNFIQKIK